MKPVVASFDNKIHQWIGSQWWDVQREFTHHVMSDWTIRKPVLFQFHISLAHTDTAEVADFSKTWFVNCKRSTACLVIYSCDNDLNDFFFTQVATILAGSNLATLLRSSRSRVRVATYRNKLEPPSTIMWPPPQGSTGTAPPVWHHPLEVSWIVLTASITSFCLII